MSAGEIVTQAMISSALGVTRACVSQWSSRHEDFPPPAGRTSRGPVYDLDAVRAWAIARGWKPVTHRIENGRVVPIEENAR